MRRPARFVLGLLLVASLLWTAWNLWQLWHNPLVHMTVERSAEAIGARLEAELIARASPDRMAARLDTLLVEDPRDWARIDAITELADARDLALPDATATAVQEARDADHGLLTTASQCAACVWDVENCRWSVLFLCRGPIELTVLGDIASVARETAHYVAGKEVDDIDLVLSTVGIGAVVIAPLVGGTSLTLKVGAGATKLAYRAGFLATPVVAEGRRLALNAVDWPMLAKARPGRYLDDLGKAVRPEAMKPITDFVGNVFALRQSLGTRWSFFVLRKAESGDDVRKLAAVARVGGRKTPGALEMLGAGRLIRIAARWSDEVWAVVSGVLGFIASALGLFGSAVKTVTLRLLRRAARAPA